jgi:serine/threonine kinase PknH
MQALRPGDPQQVGQYRLLKRLGSGGMGQVYLGQSPSGRPVAVKVIRADYADNADFRQRFRQEVQAAKRVSGIYTAAVVDADPDAPRPWMVTSFVPGPSLAAAVESRGPLSVEAVRILAAGLVSGLCEVHEADLVHRDLKPSNVLLANDGPRIIDFGISRPADSTGPPRPGGVIGSPGFMSPEQAAGDTVGPASDIFCLGSVLAYAATGEPPFGAGPPSALLYRVVYGEASTVNIPSELRPIIASCLVRDPAARPTTDELLAEIGDATPVAGWVQWQDSGSAPAARSQSAVPSAAWHDAVREAGGPDHGLQPRPVGVGSGAGQASALAARVVADLNADADLAAAAAAADANPARAADDERLADVPRHLAKLSRLAAGRSTAAGPRHRRPEHRGTRAALAAASCVLTFVIAGTLALSLLSRPEPGQPAAGPATSNGSVAFQPRRHNPAITRHGQAPEAAGTAQSALRSNSASAPSSPARSPSTSPAEIEPTTVVLDFFAAVDQGNWAAAWALGGDNLYPNRAALVAGYADETGENVTVVSASGDTVIARVQTTSSWGLPEAHTQQFVVRHGVIVARGPAGFRY